MQYFRILAVDHSGRVKLWTRRHAIHCGGLYFLLIILWTMGWGCAWAGAGICKTISSYSSSVCSCCWCIARANSGPFCSYSCRWLLTSPSWWPTLMTIRRNGWLTLLTLQIVRSISLISISSHGADVHHIFMDFYWAFYISNFCSMKPKV